jgi:hypothetical protein
MAGVLCLVSAAPAFACNFYFASSYMSIPARPSFGVGVAGEFSDPAYWGFSGDVAMKLGDKAVVRPGIGMCSGNSETDPFFGAGVAYNLTQSGTMSLNLQSGISYLTFDGGNEMVIPVGAAASFKGTGNMSFYAGASMWFWSYDYDVGGSGSDSDPVLFGGLMANSGSMSWTLGGQLLMGDDTDFGIVAGLSLNQGAAAIRHIGSLFRK